ncbi:ribonuclease H-like protein [Hymenopellis radicata]|nr:ribonuclease H-like protein [Hymenopellis radicata]
MQSIDVYIDGSFLRRSRDAGSGVWWGHSDPRNVSLKCPGNIRDSGGAELYAAVGFLEQIGATQSCDQVPPGVTHFNINTDSFFVILSLDICRPTWKKYGWRNQTKRPIAYEGMIRYIDSLVENARLQRDVHISFTYVPAHRGITGNCGADYLAGKASRDDSWPRRRIWQKTGVRGAGLYGYDNAPSRCSLELAETYRGRQVHDKSMGGRSRPPRAQNYGS